MIKKVKKHSEQSKAKIARDSDIEPSNLRKWCLKGEDYYLNKLQGKLKPQKGAMFPELENQVFSYFQNQRK